MLFGLITFLMNSMIVWQECLFMWTEKYRPKVLSEVAGNDDLRGKINQWLRTWNSSCKPILFNI